MKLNARNTRIGLLVATALLVASAGAPERALAAAPKIDMKAMGWTVLKGGIKLALGALANGGAQAIGGLIGKIPGLPQEIKDILGAFTSAGISVLARETGACLDKATKIDSAFFRCFKDGALKALKAAAVDAAKSAVNAALDQLEKGAGWVTQQLGGLINKFAKFIPGVGGALESLRDTLVSIAGEGAKELVGGLKKCVSTFKEFTGPAVKAVLTCVKNFMKGDAPKKMALAAVKGGLKGLLGVLAQGAGKITEVLTGLANKLGTFVPSLKDGIMTIKDVLASVAGDMVDQFKGAGTSCIDKLKALTGTDFRGLATCFKDAALKTLKSAGPAAVKAGMKAALKLLEKGVGAVKDALSGLITKFGSAVSAIKAPLNTINDILKGIADGATRGFMDKALTCPDKLTALTASGFKPVLDCLKDAAKAAGGSALLGGAQTGIKKLIELVGQGAQALKSKIADLKPILSKIPSIGTGVSELSKALESAVGAGAATFQEKGMACAGKLVKLDGTSFKAVLSCVKDAALAAVKVGGLTAAREGLKKLVGFVSKGAEALTGEAGKFITTISKLNKTLGDALKEVKDVLASAAKGASSTFEAQGMACPDKLTEFTKDAFMKVVTCFKGVLKAAGGAGLVAGAQAAIGKAIALVAKGAKALASGVGTILSAVTKGNSTLGTVMTQLTDVLKAAAGGGAAAFVDTAKECPAKLTKVDSTSLKAVLACLKVAKDAALKAGKLAGAQEGIRKIIKLATTGGKKALPEVMKFLKLFEKAAPDLAAMTSIFESMGDQVFDAFEKLAGECPEKLTAFNKEAALEVVECLKMAAVSAPEKAGDDAINAAADKEAAADEPTEETTTTTETTEETKAEEPAAEEAKSEEPAAEEAKSEEPAAEEAAAEDSPPEEKAEGEAAEGEKTEEAKSEEPAAEEPAADEAKGEEAAAEDTPPEEKAEGEASEGEAPAEEAKAEEEAPPAKTAVKAKAPVKAAAKKAPVKAVVKKVEEPAAESEESASEEAEGVESSTEKVTVSSDEPPDVFEE